jgi:hypothetical protein
MNSNRCWQVGPLPSAGGRLVGCFLVSAPARMSRPASKPPDHSLRLILSLLPRLTALRISTRPPPDRCPMRLGSPLLSRAYPQSRIHRCPAPPGQISHHRYGEPNLAHQQGVVGLHDDHGEERAPHRTTSQLPPMMLHCLWCPFLHWFPLPCRSAPCSHFCPVDLLRAPTAIATRGSALVASNLQVPQVPTTRSHLVLRVIFMWTYRWNRSLQWGDVGLGFPYCSTCELLQIMVSVLGCDAGVYHCCRDLGPWCDHGDFPEAWEPLKRAEGEYLRFSSYVVKVMPAVVLRWYLLQAGFVRHLWYR